MPLTKAVLATGVLVGILTLSCDDGEGLTTTTTGPTASSYSSDVKPLGEEMDSIRRRFGELLWVRDATSNISYAQGTTEQLLGRASALRPKLKAINPPTRSQDSHALLV